MVIISILTGTIVLQWICMGLLVLLSNNRNKKHDKKVDNALEAITVTVIDPICAGFEDRIQTLFTTKQNEITNIYDCYGLIDQDGYMNNPKLREAKGYQTALIDAKVTLRGVIRDVTRKHSACRLLK